MILMLNLIDRMRMIELLPSEVEDATMGHLMEDTKGKLVYNFDEIKEWNITFENGKISWNPALLLETTYNDFEINIFVIEAIKKNIRNLFHEKAFKWEPYLKIHDMLFNIDIEPTEALESRVSRLEKIVQQLSNSE